VAPPYPYRSQALHSLLHFPRLNHTCYKHCDNVWNLQGACHARWRITGTGTGRRHVLDRLGKQVWFTPVCINSYDVRPTELRTPTHKRQFVITVWTTVASDPGGGFPAIVIIPSDDRLGIKFQNRAILNRVTYCSVQYLLLEYIRMAYTLTN
jgi:hypothetical protein